MATVVRCFPLHGYGDDFVTGICSDGRQVVMGLLCPWLAAYFFTLDGKLDGKELRLWEIAAPRFENEGPFKIYDESFQSAL